jgi:uncharacterized membrane protein (DUF4010 family)
MSLPLSLFLATVFGALLGLGRESSSHQDDVTSGIRTFSLVSLMGGLAGVFYLRGNLSLLVIIMTAVCALILAYYIVGSLISCHPGMTTEVALLYAFFIGFLTVSELLSIQLILALVVVAILIVSLKEQTKKFVRGISTGEMRSFVIYAVLALVVLPFLPNTSVRLSDVPTLSEMMVGFNLSLGSLAGVELLNPRTLWFIVVLITGIDVAGYVLGRFLGDKRSSLVASLVGGMVSSTATTQALAQKSVRIKAVNGLVGAAVMANMASFFQIFLLLAPLNRPLLKTVAPVVILLIVTSFVIGLFFLSRRDHVEDAVSGVSDEVKRERKIFSLKSALKFALLLTIIKVVTKVCLVLFGQSGFLFSSVLASLAGLDAILINLADNAGKTMLLPAALLVFVLVNATNLISKSVYAVVQGSRQFSLRFSIAMGLVIVSSLIGYLVLV